MTVGNPRRNEPRPATRSRLKRILAIAGILLLGGLAVILVLGLHALDPAADAAKKQLVYEQLLKSLGEEEDRTG